MKWIGVFLSVLAAACALISARYWYRSSKVEATPAVPADPYSDIPEMAWTLANTAAISEAGKLNAPAAYWAGASALLSAAAAMTVLII
jgi:hypothetical protein